MASKLEEDSFEVVRWTRIIAVSADERVGDVCDGRGQAASRWKAAVHVGMGHLLDLHAIANDGTDHNAAAAETQPSSAKLSPGWP